MNRFRALVGVLAAAALAFVAAPAHAFYDGNGFRLDEAHALLPAYTIRIVGVDNPLLRAEAERIAADYESITGLTATVDPDTTTAHAPLDGEILVEVSATACNPDGRQFACTTPYRGCRGPRADVYYQLAAIVWITPVVFGEPLRFSHDVAHELGHAFGLQHYDATFEGHLQLMHTTKETATTFESGDRNGLLFERDWATPDVSACSAG